MKKATIILLILLAMQTTRLAAQDFRTAMHTLQDRYATLNSLHLVMQLSKYDSASANPKYGERIEIKKSGDNFHYHWGTCKMLLSEKSFLLVTDETKSIQYAPRQIVVGTSAPAVMNLDSLLAHTEIPEYIGRIDSIDHYRLKQDETVNVNLWISLRSKFISKLEYDYKNGDRTTIDFVLFDADPLFEPTVFQESQYVIVEGKSIRPAPAYANYSVH